MLIAGKMREALVLDPNQNEIFVSRTIPYKEVMLAPDATREFSRRALAIVRAILLATCKETIANSRVS